MSEKSERARAKRATYFIVSLGCSKNLTDSERVNASLSREGFSPAKNEHVADLIIINTCGFINDAKKESIDVILDAIDVRDANVAKGRQSKVVVTGCLSQRYLSQIKDEIPEIDLLYGIPDDEFVRRLVRLVDPDRDVHGGLVERLPLDGSVAYEYLKISDGCSNNCSYCAIPLIRGPIRSFSPDEILKDASAAAVRGAKELNVIAQDIAAYDYKGYRLHDLLKDLGTIDIPWIRLLYCHPDHLDDRIVHAIRDIPRIVHYLDIPIQHANGAILRRMNRKGDLSTYLKLVSDLRREIPDIAIRSTFMTGFPGEDDAAFNELLSFVEEARLDRVGCFTYSPEEGTAAAGLDDVPEEIKEERRNRLMDVQSAISAEKLEAKIGTRLRVLIESREDDGTFVGRTEYDAPEVDGNFYLTADNVAIHDIVEAEVTDSIDHDLSGVI